MEKSEVEMKVRVLRVNRETMGCRYGGEARRGEARRAEAGPALHKSPRDFKLEFKWTRDAETWRGAGARALNYQPASFLSSFFFVQMCCCSGQSSDQPARRWRSFQSNYSPSPPAGQFFVFFYFRNSGGSSGGTCLCLSRRHQSA